MLTDSELRPSTMFAWTWKFLRTTSTTLLFTSEMRLFFNSTVDFSTSIVCLSASVVADNSEIWSFLDSTVVLKRAIYSCRPTTTLLMVDSRYAFTPSLISQAGILAIAVFVIERVETMSPTSFSKPSSKHIHTIPCIQPSINTLYDNKRTSSVHDC